MSNIGRQNHHRFKTKYWQQQHQLAQPIHSILTAIHLTTSSPRTRPHSPQLIPSHISPRIIKPIQKDPFNCMQSKEHKIKLKRRLESLNNDSFNTINVSQTLSRHPYVRTSQERRQYRGKSIVERQRSRPHSNSITLEIRPGSQEYRIENRFSVVEQRHSWQFVPHTSSRYRSTFSPLL